MIRVGSILAVIAAAGALAGMLQTTPEYDRAIRPFVAEPGPDGTVGRSRMSAKITDWKTADVVTFQQSGIDRRRDTAGVFLIVTIEGRPLHSSELLQAQWLGASGRKYLMTDRVSGPAQLLDSTWFQPDLSMKSVAVFELPRDEIAGGSMLLGPRLFRGLDEVLRLAPPNGQPRHVQVDELVAG